MKVREWEKQAEANGYKFLGWNARDSQRAKVYAAENTIPATKRLEGQALLDFVSKVENSPYTIKNFGYVKHQVRIKRQGSTWAHASHTGMIHLPARSSQYLIIHEMAHTYSTRDTGGHGWLFCAVLLDLTRHFIGQETHDTLKAAFKARGVKFTVTRPKRQLSEAQREAAALRLAAAREARHGSITEPHAFVVQALDWDGNGIADRWYLVGSITGKHRMNITRLLGDPCGAYWGKPRETYLTRSTDKGIGSMFDKISTFLNLDYGNLRAIPVSQLPQGVRYLPQDWSPEA